MSEPARPRIIDAHHHVWDPVRNYHPWLSDRPVPFRYGDYDAIKRPYLPDEFRRDAAPVVDLAGSVYVETEWDQRDPRGEVEWVSALAAREGLPSAVVAQGWLHKPDAAALFAHYAGTPLVRAVRHKPSSAPSPREAAPQDAASLSHPDFRRGFVALGAAGLSFDLQTPWWNLAEARRLADAVPSVPIALNHTGLPADRDPDALRAWREAIAHFAGAPQTVVKVSGLGVPGTPWTVDANRDVVRAAIDVFGTQRVLFGSNFPVDSLVASYATIYGGFLTILSDFSAKERHAMLFENAKRFYRIDDGALA